MQSCLNVLLPPICLACGTVIESNGALCSQCWKSINFIAPPLCQCCGLPFEVTYTSDNLCLNCREFPPPYASARAVFVYDANSRNIVLGFKHGDQTHAAQALANWMHRAGEIYWPEIDFIAPVPLHRWRLFRRRYNQAALLAARIAQLANKPAYMQALVRTRATSSQGHLGKKERHNNVAEAFVVPPRMQTRVRNARIVLIDDVMTTGATLNECSRTLLRAGAQKIYALTLARTNPHI